MSVLVLLDTAGIQDYIYRQPRLQNIAISSEQLEDISSADGLFGDQIRKHGARLITAAGGNAAFTAKSTEIAKTIVRSISRELLTQGTGLEIITAIVEYSEGTLVNAYSLALAEMDARKFIQPLSVHYQLSGLEPAVVEDAIDPIRLTPMQYSDDLTLPTDHDLLICSSDEKTDLMAAVSVDWLGMGAKFNRWLETERLNNASDDDFRADFAAWSTALKCRWACAWKEATEAIVKMFPAPDYSYTHPYFPDSREIKLQLDEEGKRYLPFRMVYQGGDDLFFVCDARIALTITTSLIKALENPAIGARPLPAPFDNITASAGIVFLDSHYPFYRASQLADEVRQRAKEKSASYSATLPSTLDWWVNRQGALSRPQHLFKGSTYRPMPMHSGEESWEWFESKVLQRLWSVFVESRGKFKEVCHAAESAGQGAEVEHLLTARRIIGDLAFTSDYGAKTGFKIGDDYTPLIDAGDLYDIHFPLKKFGDADEG